MSDFLWYEAAHFLGLLSEVRDAGWPDAFTLEKLALLQFPPVGDDVANKESARKRTIIFQVLQNAVDKGEITVENRERKEDVFEEIKIDKFFWDERRDSQKSSTKGRGFIPRGAGYSPLGINRNESQHIKKTVKTGERTVIYPVIYRQPFAEWWEKHGEPYSKYVAAWLKAGGQQYTTKSKGGRKPGKQREYLEKILEALEAWCGNNRRLFDRNAMPGQVGAPDDEGSFHWFCAKLYPAHFLREPRTFEEHRAGLCVFPPYSKVNEIYSLALCDIAQSLGVSINVAKFPGKHKKSA